MITKKNKLFTILLICGTLALNSSCSKEGNSSDTDDMEMTDDMGGTDDDGNGGGDDPLISCSLNLTIDSGGPASGHNLLAEHTAITDYDPFPISYSWQPISVDGVDTAGTADYSPELIGPDGSIYRSPLPGYYDCASTDAEGCIDVKRVLYHGYYIETNELSVNGATRYPWVANDFRNYGNGTIFGIGTMKNSVEPEGIENFSVIYFTNDDNPIRWETGVYDLSAPGSPISIIYEKFVDGEKVAYQDRGEGFLQILYTKDPDFDDENQSENQLFQIKFTFFDVVLDSFGDPDITLTNSLEAKWI